MVYKNEKGRGSMAIQIDGWSVTAQFRKCGKSNCKICTDGQGHGPYYYGTKKVDGKLKSQYFGRELPHADGSRPYESARRLQAENEALRTEVAQLRAEIVVLSERLRTAPGVKLANELSRDDVQRIFVEEIERLRTPEQIRYEVWASLESGVFSDDIQEHTRLATGKGARPFVCPFRGPRYRYASAEKLVRTAIEYLVTNRVKAKAKRETIERNREEIKKHGTIF